MLLTFWILILSADQLHVFFASVYLDVCVHDNLSWSNNSLILFFFLLKIDEILGDYANLFKDHYYVKASGNCDLSRISDPHNEFKGKNVLIERKDVPTKASKLGMSVDEYAHILGICREKLFNVRSKRPRPHLDDKVSVLFACTLGIIPFFPFWWGWWRHRIILSFNLYHMFEGSVCLFR